MGSRSPRPESMSVPDHIVLGGARKPKDLGTYEQSPLRDLSPPETTSTSYNRFPSIDEGKGTQPHSHSQSPTIRQRASISISSKHGTNDDMLRSNSTSSLGVNAPKRLKRSSITGSSSLVKLNYEMELLQREIELLKTQLQHNRQGFFSYLIKLAVIALVAEKAYECYFKK
eukprot:CFRG1806T1